MKLLPENFFGKIKFREHAKFYPRGTIKPCITGEDNINGITE
ncbi:hypothetical protein Mpet_0470 [Methanolacinia petrolearia DSM 11571]|uniref:Uncharacterized protein n=1 Tax=Methanolacinia petrolearia (strain DSM 11571 / OCM 486 / SEBR 4847) TaxID=679926 RepID=E1RH20_METP4|nr:hypothetical protein Mpet_0470 [Methanolacinia petrolearia DSM 11571]